MDESFLVVQPTTPIPGCLAVVVKESKFSDIGDIERNRCNRRFLARGYISDHIPMHGNLTEILEAPSFRGIQLTDNPTLIYLHHGGQNAIYYDLCSDEQDFVQYIEVEVETDLPSNVFGPARTAINQLIDGIQRNFPIPIVISRIDILLKGEKEALAHQLVIPYSNSIIMRPNPIGGIHQYPAFSTYEGVLREVIVSPSPYYRLLCAYKLYEGLNKLKSWLKDVAKDLGVEDRLPKDPKVDSELLKAVGFNVEKMGAVNNMNDLWQKFTVLRNRVAHYFASENDAPIHISDGHTYFEYSLAASILLHYANITFSNLSQYFHAHLQPKIWIGSILPLPDYRDKFVIRI